MDEAVLAAPVVAMWTDRNKDLRFSPSLHLLRTFLSGPLSSDQVHQVFQLLDATVSQVWKSVDNAYHTFCTSANPMTA